MIFSDPLENHGKTMENGGFMGFDNGFMVILWDVPSGLESFNGIDKG